MTAIVALTAGQAFAAAGVITITGAGTKFQAMSQSVVLSDAATGLNVHCANSVIGGSLANVANAPLPYTTTQAGGAAHSITGLSLSACGNAMITVPAGYLPDDFVFTNTSSTAPQAIGVVVPAGAVPALFHVTEVGCGFDATGATRITWTNGTANQLTFVGGAQLHVVNAGGCAGLVNNGDPLSLVGNYTVVPTTITIVP
ncbi:MAG TPA: hypothetical protein VFX16_24280 [Pseudonocardiaceae bacterium]|nr:hypothetical protein [Pseudonocardiaceae bacterium]